MFFAFQQCIPRFFVNSIKTGNSTQIFGPSHEFQFIFRRLTRIRLQSKIKVDGYMYLSYFSSSFYHLQKQQNINNYAKQKEQIKSYLIECLNAANDYLSQLTVTKRKRVLQSAVLRLHRRDVVIGSLAIFTLLEKSCKIYYQT